MIKKGLKVRVLTGKDKKKKGKLLKLTDPIIEQKLKKLIWLKNTSKRQKRKKVELYQKRALFIYQTLS